MKKCMLGISLLLFAILLNICSNGLDVISLVIGAVGLVVTIYGAFSQKT